MRILFLGDFGSANTLAWIKSLRENGCDVYTASAREKGDDDIYPIGPSWLPARLRLLTGKKSLLKIIHEVKPDIMIGYRVTSYGYLGALTGFHPFVIAAQNEQINFMRKPVYLVQKLLEYFARYAIKRADLLHAWGDNIRGGLLKFGADDSKIMVMHRGIDTNVFCAGKEHFRSEKPVFISTRALWPEYKLDVIIRAFKKVHDTYPEAELKIIGDGVEQENLVELVKELKLDNNIIFLGRLQRKIVAEQLRQSTFYISIITTEGVSSSLIEASGCGVIPILADMPASRAMVVDGVTGYLIPDKDVSDDLKVSSVMIRAIEDHKSTKINIDINIQKVKNDFDNKRNIKNFIEKYTTLA